MKKVCAALLSLMLLTLLVSCGGSEFADISVSSYPSFEVYRAGSAETTDSPDTEAVFETIPPTPVTEPPETEPVTTSAPETTAAATTAAEPPATEPPVTTAVTVAETTAAPISETSTETMTRETPSTGTVYWVKNGEVWHLKESCSSLSRSKNIQSGTVSDAIAAGKERVCKRCGGSG